MMSRTSHLDELSKDERLTLRKVAQCQLMLFGDRLAWVGESGEDEPSRSEMEVLRGLWRGALIRLPQSDAGRVVVSSTLGKDFILEMRVFGEPPSVGEQGIGLAN